MKDIDEEAAVLRTAGAIMDLLEDGQLHPWRDCIELARDFTSGDGRAASNLASKALTEFLDVPCVWTGDRGSRMIGWPQPRTVVQSVACTKCGAPSGQVCVNISPTGKRPKLHPHQERELAAVQGSAAALAHRR